MHGHNRANVWNRLALIFLVAISFLAAASPSRAQVLGQVAPPPVREALDENGVDVLRGKYSPPAENALSIGPADHGGLSLTQLGGNAGVSSLVSAIKSIGGQTVVTLGGISDSFPGMISSSESPSTEGNGATLKLVGGTYTYKSRDGVVAEFAANAGYVYNFYYGELGRLDVIKYPDGSKINVTMKVQEYCRAGYENGNCNGPLFYVARVQSLKHSNGYQFKAYYANNADPLDNISYPGWSTITDVIALNTAIESCAPQSDFCSPSGTWPRRSTSTPPPTHITTTIDGSYRVATATNRGVTYSYSYSDSGTTRTTTVTDPDSKTQVFVGDVLTNRISSYTDQLGKTTSYLYDSLGRVTEVTAPEGNKTKYTYDARGNVSEVRNVAKPGSGLADIVTTASFPATCSNAVTCNKPIWTRDAKGNQTDYTYDATHGGILTQTAPAAPGGIRPETRYAYTLLASNAYALTAISRCQTSSTCVGTADEEKTTIAYGGASTNYRVASVTKASGNGAVSATSSFTYDNVGNLITVDGPLAGAADTVRYRYDGKRRRVGVAGPDPDGAGSRPHAATRITYNDTEWVATKVEAGTVTSQSDGAWAAFAPAETVTSSYDANVRKAKDVLSSGATDYAVAQYSYDALGRLQCRAQRMNTAIFGSLPASACTLGTTGSHGPDRIVKTIYDGAGRPTKVQAAFGTTEQADEVTAAYTDNGGIAYVVDAENNRTGNIYDGHDRPVKTEYPSATKGANVVNGADYEQLTYDANGNVTSRRLRDGQTVGYTYDNLNRVTYYDQPVSGAYWDLAYEHDLLGRLKKATGNGWAVNAFTYDALGRLTYEQNYNAATYHAYDAAGRQTRLSWHDGFYVDYDYDATGNVTAIRENGATSGVGVLATYSYDNLGRRTAVTRGNGTVTSYGFDAVSRLTSLNHDLAGSTHDLALGFIYNPASQISSSTRSNDLYAWGGHYNVDRSYTANGRNQLTAAGGTSLGYDARGNLTSSGSSSYGYTVENRMTSGPGGTMAYEPTGERLLGTYAGGVDTRFAWSGAQMITEISGTSWQVLRRYVPGPRFDEPVVWYEGAGTSDRRWLHADERGSIVSVTDSAGATIAINRYDEYGIPGAGNVGRFGYTGQAWLPEVGLWYYKARMYSPTLGRFMQTDPIGYGDGMNWYNYVGSDPVNGSDPTGLSSRGIVEGGGPKPIIVTGTRIDYSFCHGCSSALSFLGETAIREALAAVSLAGIRADPQEIVVEASCRKGVNCQPQKPKKAPCFSIQDQRQHHDQWVAKEAQRLRAAGYAVATEVSIRVWASTRPTSVLARADIVATIPGSNIYVVNEIKTGNADFSKNQETVYGATGGNIAGINGVGIGLNPGDWISLSDFSTTRCLGLRQGE